MTALPHTNACRWRHARAARVSARRLRWSDLLERLEDRSCPSVYYDLEVLTQTGRDGLVGIDPGVSINDLGRVAFVASTANGQSLFTSDGTTVADLTPGLDQAGRFFFNSELQINNKNQVGAYLRTISGGTTLTQVKIWDATNPGATATTIATGSLLNPVDPYWDAVLSPVGTTNHAPVLTPIADQVVTEGSPLTVRIVATDPDAGDTIHYELDSGAPLNAMLNPNTGELVLGPGFGSAYHTFTVRAVDNGSPALDDVATFHVTVTNVAPSVAAGGDARVPVNTAFVRVGGFTDPGFGDSFTATVDYGDGGGAVPLTLTARSFNLSHTYSATGSYTVDVTVIDASGAAGAGAFRVDVSQAAVATVTQLSAAPNPVTLGGSVTLTATVRAGIVAESIRGLALSPSGTVLFFQGTNALGQAPLDGNGVATYTLTPEAVGTYTITATYAGDGIFVTSTSNAVSLNVARPSVEGPRVVAARRLADTKQAGELILWFSRTLDPARAQDVANYQVRVAGCGRAVAVVSATYNPADQTVTLRTRGALPRKYRYLVSVNGTAPGGLTDPRGYYLEGAGPGHPATNYQTIIDRHDVYVPPRSASQGFLLAWPWHATTRTTVTVTVTVPRGPAALLPIVRRKR